MNGDVHRTRWRLKEWREHFGLTGEKLAALMGTTKATISKLERSLSFKTIWLDRYCSTFSVLAKRLITVRDLARLPDQEPLEDLLDGASPDEQQRARDVLRALLGVKPRNKAR